MLQLMILILRFHSSSFSDVKRCSMYNILKFSSRYLSYVCDEHMVLYQCSIFVVLEHLRHVYTQPESHPTHIFPAGQSGKPVPGSVSYQKHTNTLAVCCKVWPTLLAVVPLYPVHIDLICKPNTQWKWRWLFTKYVKTAHQHCQTK